MLSCLCPPCFGRSGSSDHGQRQPASKARQTSAAEGQGAGTLTSEAGATANSGAALLAASNVDTQAVQAAATVETTASADQSTRVPAVCSPFTTLQLLDSTTANEGFAPAQPHGPRAEPTGLPSPARQSPTPPPAPAQRRPLTSANSPTTSDAAAATYAALPALEAPCTTSVYSDPQTLSQSLSQSRRTLSTAGGPQMSTQPSSSQPSHSYLMQQAASSSQSAGACTATVSLATLPNTAPSPGHLCTAGTLRSEGGTEATVRLPGDPSLAPPPSTLLFSEVSTARLTDTLSPESGDYADSAAAATGALTATANSSCIILGRVPGGAAAAAAAAAASNPPAASPAAGGGRSPGGPARSGAGGTAAGGGSGFSLFGALQAFVEQQHTDAPSASLGPLSPPGGGGGGGGGGNSSASFEPFRGFGNDNLAEAGLDNPTARLNTVRQAPSGAAGAAAGSPHPACDARRGRRRSPAGVEGRVPSPSPLGAGTSGAGRQVPPVGCSDVRSGWGDGLPAAAQVLDSRGQHDAVGSETGLALAAGIIIGGLTHGSNSSSLYNTQDRLVVPAAAGPSGGAVAMASSSGGDGLQAQLPSGQHSSGGINALLSGPVSNLQSFDEQPFGKAAGCGAHSGAGGGSSDIDGVSRTDNAALAVGGGAGVRDGGDGANRWRGAGGGGGGGGSRGGRMQRNAERREFLSAARCINAVLQDVQVISVLGAGAHGKVYKGAFRDRFVAVKVILHETDAPSGLPSGIAGGLRQVPSTQSLMGGGWSTSGQSGPLPPQSVGAGGANSPSVVTDATTAKPHPASVTSHGLGSGSEGAPGTATSLAFVQALPAANEAAAAGGGVNGMLDNKRRGSGSGSGPAVHTLRYQRAGSSNLHALPLNLPGSTDGGSSQAAAFGGGGGGASLPVLSLPGMPPVVMPHKHMLEGLISASAQHPNIVETYRIVTQLLSAPSMPAFTVTRGSHTPLWETTNLTGTALFGLANASVGGGGSGSTAGAAAGPGAVLPGAVAVAGAGGGALPGRPQRPLRVSSLGPNRERSAPQAASPLGASSLGAGGATGGVRSCAPGGGAFASVPADGGGAFASVPADGGGAFASVPADGGGSANDSGGAIAQYAVPGPPPAGAAGRTGGDGVVAAAAASGARAAADVCSAAGTGPSPPEAAVPRPGAASGTSADASQSATCTAGASAAAIPTAAEWAAGGVCRDGCPVDAAGTVHRCGSSIAAPDAPAADGAPSKGAAAEAARSGAPSGGNRSDRAEPSPSVDLRLRDYLSSAPALPPAGASASITALGDLGGPVLGQPGTPQLGRILEAEAEADRAAASDAHALVGAGLGSTQSLIDVPPNDNGHNATTTTTNNNNSSSSKNTTNNNNGNAAPVAFTLREGSTLSVSALVRGAGSSERPSGVHLSRGSSNTGGEDALSPSSNRTPSGCGAVPPAGGSGSGGGGGFQPQPQPRPQPGPPVCAVGDGGGGGLYPHGSGGSGAGGCVGVSGPVGEHPAVSGPVGEHPAAACGVEEQGGGVPAAAHSPPPRQPALADARPGAALAAGQASHGSTGQEAGSQGDPDSAELILDLLGAQAAAQRSHSFLLRQRQMQQQQQQQLLLQQQPQHHPQQQQQPRLVVLQTRGVGGGGDHEAGDEDDVDGEGGGGTRPTLALTPPVVPRTPGAASRLAGATAAAPWCVQDGDTRARTLLPPGGGHPGSAAARRHDAAVTVGAEGSPSTPPGSGSETPSGELPLPPYDDYMVADESGATIVPNMYHLAGLSTALFSSYRNSYYAATDHGGSLSGLGPGAVFLPPHILSPIGAGAGAGAGGGGLTPASRVQFARASHSGGVGSGSSGVGPCGIAGQLPLSLLGNGVGGVGAAAAADRAPRADGAAAAAAAGDHVLNQCSGNIADSCASNASAPYMEASLALPAPLPAAAAAAAAASRTHGSTGSKALATATTNSTSWLPTIDELSTGVVGAGPSSPSDPTQASGNAGPNQLQPLTPTPTQLQHQQSAASVSGTRDGARSSASSTVRHSMQRTVSAGSGGGDGGGGGGTRTSAGSVASLTSGATTLQRGLLYGGQLMPADVQYDKLSWSNHTHTSASTNTMLNSGFTALLASINTVTGGSNPGVGGGGVNVNIDAASIRHAESGGAAGLQGFASRRTGNTATTGADVPLSADVDLATPGLGPAPAPLPLQRAAAAAASGNPVDANELIRAPLMSQPLSRSFTDARSDLRAQRRAAAAGLAASPGAAAALAGSRRERWQVLIVQELCTRGNLRDAIVSGVFHASNAAMGTQVIAMRQLLDTAAEIASAMSYLHSRSIVHGDLKTANVLLQRNDADPRGFVAKLADFGLARQLGPRGAEDGLLVSRIGTVTHMAPETIRDNRVLLSSDVYSFGVIMWELYCAQQPFANYTAFQLLSAVVQYDERPQFPVHCPPSYAALAIRCMAKNPQDRPTFAEVYGKLLAIRDELYGGSGQGTISVPLTQAQSEATRILQSHLQIVSGSMTGGCGGGAGGGGNLSGNLRLDGTNQDSNLMSSLESWDVYSRRAR